MAGPNIPVSVAPSTRSWLGVAREMTTGTPVLPTNVIPQDAKSYKPEDTPKFLPDEAIRGSMALTYGQILGPEDATLNFGGPVFLDTHGFMLDNTFGDLSATGAGAANTTTLASATSVGATTASITADTGYSDGSYVQIDTGPVAEVVQLSAAPSGAGPYTVTFAGYPLRFPHAQGTSVSTVTAPFTSRFALLNSDLGYGGIPGAQPPTHTLTDHTSLTATVGARSYPSACLSKLDFTGNAEQLLEVKFTGNSWLSAPASASPVKTLTAAEPVAAWQSAVKIGGTPVYDIGDWAVSVTRKLQTYWTAQGSPNPFVIARGELSITGTLNFTVAEDESALLYMLNNTQPSLQITLSNGLSGANELAVTFTATKAAFTKSAPDRNAVLIGYQTSFDCVANTTDVGGSGGLGPGTFTVTSSLIY